MSQSSSCEDKTVNVLANVTFAEFFRLDRRLVPTGSHVIVSHGPCRCMWSRPAIDLLSDHISGIPSHGCPAGILGGSLASERCSESGRHAVKGVLANLLHTTRPSVKPLTLQIPHATVHSSFVAEA